MSVIQFTTERVLIWGKTYPELSKRYAETVCTAGVRENGTPIRLYPVPLRYLGSDSQYRLYDWVDVPICKSHLDSRPESFKVDAAKIRCTGHIDPDSNGWSNRANYIFRDPTWQYESMREVRQAQATTKHSLGILTPGTIEGIDVKEKPANAKQDYETQLAAIQRQGNFFLEEYKELGYRPFDVKLRWTCATPCEVCAKNPHDMLVLDWGLMELARKNNWSRDLARARLEELALSGKHDFKLFVGNMKNHPKSFVIIGLWYPKKVASAPPPPQLNLL
jgi:hypothetical protein